MTIKVTYNVTDVYMTQSVSPVYINVSYSGGGTSGGGVWGSITGTLSNQTDLQNALNAKFDDPTGTTAQYLRGDGSLATFPALTGYVPYTGATTNVDLGEYELKAGQLTLDVSPTGTAAVGTTRWNDTTGVSETTLKGGNVLLRNGVDLVARVVNKVTPNTTLTKAAYQAVRVSGAQGQRLAVAFAQANNDANSADTIGLVTETIPTNQEGFIMAVGQLENINTTGSLQGETWVDGDVLYLSPTTAGAITKVKPTGNGHIVVIGYVEYAHANNGKIYVKVMNGWELTELHDTEIVSPANNEALIYESSSALWKNKTIATALGYTPANAATTLTINGVTYDLSTSRTWTIAAGISGSGAAGQVTYWSGTSAVSGSNNLTFSPTPSAASGLGVSLNLTPTLTAAANNDVLTAIDLQPTFTNGAFTGVSNYAIRATGQVLIRRVGGNATEGFSMQYVQDNTLGGAYQSKFVSLAPGVAYRDLAFVSRATLFQIDGFRNSLLISNNGNVVVNSLTDASTAHKFQVYGDTLLRGSGATSATTALTVQNSSSTNLFTVRNDGAVAIGTASYNDGLRINRNPILASASSIFVNTAIQTTVNTIYRGIATSVGLFGSGFTLPNLSHFECINDGSFTAGVVTNLYGFRESLGTYVATNVYGFYGAIPSASGRWSLYMAGSADNYLAGDLGIGTTSVTNWLNIGASTTAKAHMNLASGVAPTSPANGDIWFDGTDIKMRIGGVTKTFTLI